MKRLSQSLIDERAERLQQARRAKYRSAGAAAAALRLGASSVRAHENGQNGYTVDAAKGYADAYGVTLDWLLFGTPPASPSNPMDNSEAQSQPASRPSGPGEMGRQPNRCAAPANTVFVEFSGRLPVAVAAQVLALLREANP